MTVSILAEEFLRRYVAERLRPSTYRGYKTNLENHVLPTLGGMQIAEITPDELYELTETLREKGLSNKSIVYVHATLRKMLAYARRMGYSSAADVYERYDLPRVDGIQYPILCDKDYITLISCADGRTPLSLAIRLAICYGLRRGEILGIVPERDLDAGQRTLHICRTRSVEYGMEKLTPCKTKSSDRYILLLQEDVDALLSRKTFYAVPLTPTQLNKGFSKFLRIHGFPAMRFHDLRHNYATYMLRHGIDVKTISTVLGHSSVKITLDIYTHPNVEFQKNCLEVLP